jgi:DNA-binding NtrC family response regulator/tetratricopeptide (TPR) repeat protein
MKESKRIANLFKGVYRFLNRSDYESALLSLEEIIATLGIEGKNPGKKRVEQDGFEVPMLRALVEKTFVLASMNRRQEAERVLSDIEEPMRRKGGNISRELQDIFQGKIALVRGWEEVRKGNHEGARTELEHAITLLKPTAEHHAFARALELLGNAYYYTGDINSAERLYEDALSIYRRRLRNERGICRVLNFLGLIFDSRGEWERATKSLESALDYAFRLGNSQYMSNTTGNLARIYIFKGKLNAAENLLHFGLKLHSEKSNYSLMALDYYNLSSIARYRSDVETGEEYLKKGLELAERSGNRYTLLTVQIGMADIEMLRGNHTKCKALLLDVRDRAAVICPEGKLAGAVQWRLAELAIEMNETEEAVGYAQKAMEMASVIQSFSVAGAVLKIQGKLNFLKGDMDGGCTCFDKAIEHFAQSDLEYCRSVRDYLHCIRICSGTFEKYDTVLSLALKARERLSRLALPSLKCDLYQELSWLCLSQKHFTEAMEYLDIAGRETVRMNVHAVESPLAELRTEIQKEMVRQVTHISTTPGNGSISGNDERCEQKSLSSLMTNIAGEMDATRGIIAFLPRSSGRWQAGASINVDTAELEHFIGGLTGLKTPPFNRDMPVFISIDPAKDVCSEFLPSDTESVLMGGCFSRDGGNDFDDATSILDGIIYVGRRENGIRHPFDFEDLRRFTARLPEITHMIERARREHSPIEREMKTFGHLQTANPLMRSIFDKARKIASFNGNISCILIDGDTGTGKSLLAEALHGESKRRENPFYIVHCANLNENLLESDLFGYTAGAFTDARNSKKGVFELANGGTIFLDEIDCMSLEIQAKLLRVIESRRFRPVGGERDMETDIQIIAATNKPLEDLVERGSFRKDLYYRLNVVRLSVPPLRKRKEDIPFFLDMFLDTYFREREEKPVIDRKARALLLEYSWPGNIRELSNFVQQLSTLYGDVTEISASLVEKLLRGAARNGCSPCATEKNLDLDSAIKDVLREAIYRCRGNIRRMSQYIDRTEKTTLNMIRRYQLTDDLTLARINAKKISSTDG